LCGGHGIVVDNGLMSDVSLNAFNQINLNGIVLQNGTNLATVELNTFSPALAVGVYLLGAHDNYIHRNKVSSTFGAIFLDGGSANNVVEDNQLDHCGFACLMNRFSSGGNRIAFNDLETSVAYGVWQHHGEGDEVFGNVFKNVPTMTCNSTVAFFSYDLQFCAP
jgi:parallel beta-helix repeat protein